MNQFQKNVLFVAATVGVLGLLAFGISFALQEHQRHLDEQKVAWPKSNIKSLKDLSVIGALSTEEQIRVDNAGDDFLRLQQVLLDIHQERANFWAARLKDAKERQQKLQNLYVGTYEVSAGYGIGSQFSETARDISKQQQEATSSLEGFEAAKERIRAWKPITWDDFQSGKLDPQAANPRLQLNEQTPTQVDFQSNQYPQGYLVNELCEDAAPSDRFCYRYQWKPWLKELERQVAGEQDDVIVGDSGTQSPGNFTMAWDSEKRVVFRGCRAHDCPSAYAYFIVAPASHEMDIVWKGDLGVKYFGPHASLLESNNAIEWLDRVQ